MVIRALPDRVDLETLGIGRLFAYVRDAVVVVDCETGTIHHWNPAATEILGFREQEVVGSPLSAVVDVVLPKSEPRRPLRARRPSAASTPTIEVPARRKDGSELVLAVSTTCLESEVNASGDYCVVMFRDLTEQVANRSKLADAERLLAHQTLHDALTGLPNRTQFKREIERALTRRKADGGQLSVIMVDLDDFKTVNDSLTHVVGDLLLVAVSRRLGQCLEQTDHLARIGGDEFGVLLGPGATVHDGPLVAQRIIESLYDPVLLDGKEVYMRASVGLCTAEPYQDDADDIIRKAEVAMYGAKKAGKGGYETFEPGMYASVLRRLQLRGGLARVLDRDELRLLFQPIVSLSDKNILGAEALIRWAHPDLGLLAPAHFISIAEESGLSVPIGEWVLRRACLEAARWEAPHQDSFITVNLSGGQLASEVLVDHVREALAQSRLAPGRLILEITENALMADTDANIEMLAALKGLGVKLAIDDFGTGYSSLSYLRRFPIDVLKIDKSFVSPVTRGPEDAALASAVVKLGRSLNMDVVAEGIETENQAVELRGMGCPMGQGFLFARPLIPQQMRGFLAASAPAFRDRSRSTSARSA